MIKINNTTMNAEETFEAINARAIGMKELETGTELKIFGYVETIILNEETGEEFLSYIFKTDKGYIATRSESFMKAYINIVTSAEKLGLTRERISFRFLKDKSRSGKEFNTCEGILD